MYINLKAGMLLRSCPQYKLAGMVDVSEPFLSMVIHGRRKPTKALRQKIASALDCDEVWLFQSRGSFHPDRLPAAALHTRLCRFSAGEFRGAGSGKSGNP